MSLAQRMGQMARFLIRLINSPLPSNQFQLLADYAPEIIPADFLAIALVDTEPGQYILHSLQGAVGSAIPRHPYPFTEGLAGLAISTRTTQLSRELAEAKGLNQEIEGTCIRFGIQSMIASPILQGETKLGAILCGSKELDAYDTDEFELIQLLSAGLAEALESARHYQLLADEHSMLEAVLRSSRDAVLLFNMQGIVLMANPAVMEMLGISENELIGQPVTATGNRAIAHLFQENQSGVVTVDLTDGRTAQAQLVPVQTAFSEHVGWAAILRDVTVFKELEQMKSDFVNTVSHDLKNPITSIVLGAHLLKAAGPLNENQVETKDRILQTADYMNQLVTDLLDLGKIEAGLELEMVETDLSIIVEQAIAPLQPQIERKRHRLHSDLPEVALVKGDAGWLRHVVTNLVSNAQKYTPDEGEIIVRLQQASGQMPDSRLALSGVILSVSDNGYGIPAGDLPHIFDKFFRSTTEATANISGTGLGLAMTKSIIQAHNGYIWAESEEGHGTTFSFYLPSTTE